MRDWLTAAEIAAAHLPGIPGSKRGVQKLADREDWMSQRSPTGEALTRRRKGEGGGFEYHVSLLPAGARLTLKSEGLKGTVVSELPRIVAPPPATITEADMLRRDARLALLAVADAHFVQNRGIGQTAADYDFCLGYNLRKIEIPAWIADAVPSVSRRSLWQWRRMRDTGDWHSIGGRYLKRRGKSELAMAEDGEVARYIGGLIVAQPHLTADHIRDLVESRFALAKLPSLRSFRRFLSDWKEKNSVALAKLTNPDGYRNAIRFAGSNAYAHIRRLNELWEIDASPADVLCKDGRYSIYVGVDIWSRRMVTYVSKTARTEAALLLIRRAVLQWGVPEEIRTDNGSDFTSHRMKRALHSLGIRHDEAPPFSPEEKGVVERGIGTLQRGLMPLLPGFIGHNVSDRKQIEARKAFAARLGETDEKIFCVDLDHQELQAAMDDWCAHKYGHRPHDGLDGQAPFLKAQSYTGTLRKIENIHALDLLLAPIAGSDGFRTVTKQGIRLDHGHYFAPQLLAGMRVYCRMDPEDMGRLYAFESETGAFIAEAICPERAGADPRQAVARAREAQAEFIREQTEEIRREARRIKPRDMVNDVLGLARRKSQVVMPFPRTAEAHSTPALIEAAAALDGAGAVPARPADAPITSNVVALPETEKQRFRRALGIQAAIESGRAVDPAEGKWLVAYVQTPEFKAHSDMLEDFGREWLEA